jgi:hypothetical protein
MQKWQRNWVNWKSWKRRRLTRILKIFGKEVKKREKGGRRRIEKERRIRCIEVRRKKNVGYVKEECKLECRIERGLGIGTGIRYRYKNWDRIE